MTPWVLWCRTPPAISMEHGDGLGVVYKIDPSGNETVLYSFTGGADGGNPDSNVVLDSAGNLYGVTAGGGANGNGVIYQLDPSGNETVLYNFDFIDDYYPEITNLALSAGGRLFGTATGGGTHNAGAVFEIKP
jgi:uncharacterized repeat protein (TIGR03803 family)